MRESQRYTVYSKGCWVSTRTPIFLCVQWICPSGRHNGNRLFTFDGDVGDRRAQPFQGIEYFRSVTVHGLGTHNLHPASRNSLTLPGLSHMYISEFTRIFSCHFDIDSHFQPRWGSLAPLIWSILYPIKIVVEFQCILLLHRHMKGCTNSCASFNAKFHWSEAVSEILRVRFELWIRFEWRYRSV